jgi:RNA polymerase sigma factor (sigma-70 family)
MASADTDSARQWVEAAQRVPLLTPAEEIHLSALVQAWQQHPDGPDNAPPAVQRRGLRARNRIVAANLRLVAKFVQSRKHAGPLVDRFQNGTLGLVRAAELFDPERGYRFSTFAYWWLRAEVGRGEFAEPLIKLPSNVHAALRGTTNGDCPAHLLADGRAASFVRSLDYIIPGCDSELTLGDTLAAAAPDEQDPDADELAMRMAALDPLEQRLIEGRWGLRAARKRTC